MDSPEDLASQLRDMKREKQAARMEVLVKNKTIEKLEKEVRDLRSDMAEMKAKKLRELEAQKSRGLETKKETYKNGVQQTDKTMERLRKKVINYKTQIEQKNSDLHVRDNTIAALAEELASVKADANTLSNMSLSRVRKHRILKNNLMEKDTEIGNLKEQVRRLQEELRYFHGEHDTPDNM